MDKEHSEPQIDEARASVDVAKSEAESQNQLVGSDGDVYLIPTPTRDPADPLNWHPARKWAIIVLLMFWSSAALSIQAFLLNYVPSVKERFPDANPNQINLILTLIMPMVAPGQLFFTPLAIAYGRRLSLLLANALLVGSCLWGAFSASYNSLLVARVFEGLAGGPTDCLVYVYVQEMTFIHERGTVLGVLMAGQLVLQLSFSIATNYMAIKVGFQGPFFMFTGIAAATLVGLFFVMPESRYDREDNHLLPRVKVSDYPAFRKAVGTGSADGEFKEWTLRRQVKPWSTKVKGSKHHSVFWFFKRMSVYLLSPAMWWNAGINTIMCGSLLAAQTYFAEMLVAPPWSWAPENVGLINIGPALMAVVNWFCLGWGNDKVLLWQAKRNGGVTRVEHRLVVLAVPVITGVASSIGFGGIAQNYFITNPGSEDQPHWFSIVFTMAMYFQSFCGIIEGTLIYMANSVSAEDSLAVMTLVAVLRDLISFGMGYGIVDFSSRYGFLTSFGIYGLLTGVIGLLGIPVYIYGERIRKVTGLAV